MAGPTLPETEDVEEFIESVDEVHRLIEGLRQGTISTDYIDSKIDRKKQKNQEKASAAPNQVSRPAGHVDTPRAAAGSEPTASASASASPAQGAADQGDAEDAEEAEAERKERAMAKVKELIANRERKLRARARYEEYVKSQDRSEYGTDYTKWDIWCPEDEEDDMINSIGPNTPQFRAMEKDIDERHRQMVERRQLAERARVAGNAAYKSQQYSEALRCYQQGLEAERSNMALHANAAMAALKLSCYVQTIEHCDKVLHIADFLHNNKRDPLCVKALQRRAEAYRALQQHGKAVADLQRAAEMEPGNAEVARQLARARQDDEEARKQRAIAKAVSKGAAGAGAEGGVGALDLERLGEVERLVAALAGLGTDAGGQQGQGEGQGQGQAKEGQGQGDATGSSAGGRGPALPPRGAGKGKGSGAGTGAAAGAAAGKGADVQGLCEQLRELLKGDDASCVYFRECGGMTHLCAAICKPASPGAALAAPLLLLNEACMNDGNLKLLPSLRVLPACVGALGGQDGDAAAAAAGLLCTAVTREEVRVEVSRLLGAGDSLLRLVELLRKAGPVVQGLALALLGNCMVDKPTKAAMQAAWKQGQDKGQQAQGGTVSQCFCALLSSPNAALAERAVVLLGNMCTDAALRGELATQGELVRRLLQLATGTGHTHAGRKQGQQDEQHEQLQLAAITAAYNLCVDEAGQRLVAGDAECVRGLYGWLPPGACGAALARAARAAGLLSRVAKVAAGAALLLEAGAMARMVQLVGEALSALNGSSSSSSSSSSGSGSEREQQLGVLDSAVRMLAIFTTPDDAALARQLVEAGGVRELLRAVGAAPGVGVGESVLGNAGLCLAAVARQREHFGTLREAGAVPTLVRVAYEGKGNTASKNAAIALARMAHDPDMLQQLRDLHGIEIIYQYVKP